jgi:hypothetical protein
MRPRHPPARHLLVRQQLRQRIVVVLISGLHLAGRHDADDRRLVLRNDGTVVGGADGRYRMEGLCGVQTAGGTDGEHTRDRQSQCVIAYGH